MPRIPRVERIRWVLDGRPLDLSRDSGWRASSVALGGHERFSARVPRVQVKHAGQGAPLYGYRENGQVMWYGRLSTDPAYEADLATLQAVGPYADVERRVERLFFQSRSYDAWVQSDADPHNITLTQQQRFSLENGSGKLAWKVSKNEAYGSAAEAGYVFWVPDGGFITRVAFTIRKNVDDNNFQIAVQKLTDGHRSANLSNAATYALSAANPDGTTKSLAFGSQKVEGVVITVQSTASNTPTATFRVRLENLRVFGLATSDEFHTHRVVREVANQLGFGTSLIKPGPTNAMPLDWQYGPWTELMEYLCTLEDYRWAAREPDRQGGPVRMEFTPWPGNADAVTLRTRPEDEDLTPQELYNKVVVTWETTSGVPRRTTQNVDPDPLSQYAITNEYRMELDDPQHDNTVARNVASRLAEQVGKPRLVGTVRVPGVIDAHGISSRYYLKPGMVVKLPGRLDLPPQRVMAVTYTADDVVAEIGEEVSVARLLARTTLRRSRGRSGRKQRR